MTQKGIVKRVLADKTAEVEIERTTACGHDCSNCSSACSLAYNPKFHAVAENSIGASEGDKVMLGSSSRRMLTIAAVVYGVPVLLFLVGVVISGAAKLSGIFSCCVCVGLFIIGVIFGVIYNRKMKKRGGITYKILEIVK